MKITHKDMTDKIEVYQVAKEFVELNEHRKNYLLELRIQLACVD